MAKVKLGMRIVGKKRARDASASTWQSAANGLGSDRNVDNLSKTKYEKNSVNMMSEVRPGVFVYWQGW